MTYTERLKRANAHLANESDCKSLMLKLAVKTMHHKDQEDFYKSKEYASIQNRYIANKELIDITGRY